MLRSEGSQSLLSYLLIFMPWLTPSLSALHPADTTGMPTSPLLTLGLTPNLSSSYWHLEQFFFVYGSMGKLSVFLTSKSSYQNEVAGLGTGVLK